MTKIEWTDKTWNPITGCSKISEACDNCYAEKMANRLKGRFGYDKNDPFKITYHIDKYNLPYEWKKPCKIFVCSMGDLFHESISNCRIQEVLYHIKQNSKHIFQILTKRPYSAFEFFHRYYMENYKSFENIWLGITAEKQQCLNNRMLFFQKMKFPVKFISCEPLLGPIDISKHKDDIDWVIAGGETGANARPSHPAWFIDLKDQCKKYDIPFFFKGWGKWEPFYYVDNETGGHFTSLAPNDKNEILLNIDNYPIINMRINKEKNRNIVGVEYNNFPKI